MIQLRIVCAVGSNSAANSSRPGPLGPAPEFAGEIPPERADGFRHFLLLFPSLPLSTLPGQLQFHECNTSGLATFKHVTYMNSNRHYSSQLLSFLSLHVRSHPIVLSSPPQFTVKSDSSDTLGYRFLSKSYVSSINLQNLRIKQIIQYGNCEPFLTRE